MSNVGVNTQKYNSKHVNGNQVNNVTECEHGSLKANVLSACQGMVTLFMTVLHYDVNIGLSDLNLELSNAMLLKDGWKPT